ncbi:MAG: TetR/AcrR family transcriptional regulator [Burkholderiales bacterium]|nr:TetR/AcrR family transcriptional regulator [Burkholderiales bacterium]MDE2433804.1 TetR/AcrR family transcriptional regulator [Burkholderiales bacterium]
MEHTKPAARRGRPITRNREQVLEAAMNAYWRDDRAAVSVNAICVLADVSKPSLYRDFGSEDGLTEAVLERYAQTVLRPLETLLSSPASFATKLEAMIDFASQDPRMEVGCLFVKMRTTRSRFGVQTQAKLASIEAHFLECYIRLFREGAASGEWSGGIAAELAAGYLYEQLGLAVSQRAAGKSSESVRQLLGLALSVLR